MDSISQVSRSLLSPASYDVLMRLEQIDFSRCFFRPSPGLTSNIDALRSQELKNVLESFFAEIVKKPSVDPLKVVDHLSAILPLQALAASVNLVTGAVLDEAKTLSQAAPTYFQTTEKKMRVHPQVYVSKVFAFTVSFIDMFVKGFGIGEFFQASREKSSSKLAVYKLMGLPTIFYTIKEIVLYFDPENNRISKELIKEFSESARRAFEVLTEKVERRAKFIAAISLVSFLVFSLIWPLMKPKVTQLHEAENWTEEARAGRLKVSKTIEIELKASDIATALGSGRNVILVGPTRTGKSKIARLFAILNMEGAFPKLKEKTIFFMPTSALACKDKSLDGKTVLQYVVEETKRDEDELILILDEFQAGAKVFEELKPLLEEDGRFPPVVAITTQDEYNRDIRSNKALAERFIKINVGSTNKEETLQILKEKLLQHKDQPIALDEALEHIYSHTSNDVTSPPQPYDSLKLLDKCIELTSDVAPSKAAQELMRISEQLRSYYVHLSAFPEESVKDITGLQMKQMQLKAKVANEEIEIRQLRLSKSLFHDVTKEIFSSAQKISQLGQDVLFTHQNELNKFLLLRKFLRTALGNRIKKESEKLNVRTIIDKKMVQDICSPQFNRKNTLTTATSRPASLPDSYTSR